MATLAELVSKGRLIRLTPTLDTKQQVVRRLYATPPFVEGWLTKVLPGLKRDMDAELDPADAWEALAVKFVAGEPLHRKFDFRPRDTKAQPGVWYLKTVDLRVFGWFPEKDALVCVTALAALRTKNAEAYGSCSGYVVNARNGLKLDDPSFIAGVNPDDVLSNTY